MDGKANKPGSARGGKDAADSVTDPAAIDAPTKKPHDIVLLHGRTEDGQGVRALRARAGRLEVAELRPLQKGKPINSEIVKLHPHKKTPFICDVEVQYSPEEARSDRSSPGPAQVASRQYRRNWEAVFGKRKKLLN